MKPVNNIEFKLNILESDKCIIFEDILFSNCAFIQLFVDSKEFMAITDRLALVVWKELKKSSLNSGNFLLLTCCCGIADDGGFDFVNVTHTDKIIEWKFTDDSNIIWKFDKSSYITQIDKLQNEIEFLRVPLAPIDVIFPES